MVNCVAAGYLNTVQAGAGRKCAIANAGDAVWDGNAGQAGAVIERIIAYAGDAIRDGDAGQAGAHIERIIANGGDTSVRRNHAVLTACN